LNQVMCVSLLVNHKHLLIILAPAEHLLENVWWVSPLMTTCQPQTLAHHPST
jgi:hypothetical protein